jgi:transcriptional regulator with XRE-family HTH domain
MSNTDPKVIGTRLKFLREKFKIQQKEVAAETGLSVKTISVIENGHTPPNPEIFEYYIKTHKVSIDWLTSGTGDPVSSKKFDEKSIPNLAAKVVRIEQELSEMKILLKDLIKRMESL